MTFEWDPAKAQANVRKHGVLFVEALTAFMDPLSIATDDPDSAPTEPRLVLIGLSSRLRLLVVVHARWATISVSSARAGRQRTKDDIMKKRAKALSKMGKEKTRETPMRAEYDFRGGVRGKYSAQFSRDTIAVVLDPDVAAVFPDAESVNHALRELARVASRYVPEPKTAGSVAESGSNPPMQRTGSARR